LKLICRYGIGGRMLAPRGAWIETPTVRLVGCHDWPRGEIPVAFLPKVKNGACRQGETPMEPITRDDARWAYGRLSALVRGGKEGLRAMRNRFALAAMGRLSVTREDLERAKSRIAA